MNLAVKKEEEIKKKSFTLKPIQRDGLVLRIHHTDKNAQRIRFIYSSFNRNGHLLASSDNNGTIYIINFETHKFWGLPSVNSCTFLKFSTYKECEIIIGLRNCHIFLINIETGCLSGYFVGHRTPATQISFSDNGCFCLTTSSSEAIIWDLTTNSKLQVLNLEANSSLKHVVFVPQSKNILGVYNDDMINVWDFRTFDNVRIILPTVWENITIKNIALTEDGSIMVLSGINPKLAIYSLKTWKTLKFIMLPDYMKSIRSLKFVKNRESIEKGPEQMLTILSGQGILYFFGVMENIIISELQSEHEIVKLDYSILKSYLGCVLSNGEIEIYNATQYVDKPWKINAVSIVTDIPSSKKLKIKKSSTIKIGQIKEEIEDILNMDRLRSILKEFGEYPATYRTKIWEQLLQLPNNKIMYKEYIKQTTMSSFEDLDKEYPMENTRSLKNLKLLLNNLVTWCNFFAQVSYLPIFIYPFVKVFHNKPIACFEAIATIIVNWCQYWFEYFPLPPINILAIIENMLVDLDPELLDFLNQNSITSKQYAWPLLESAFSEVLTSSAWFVFWDHTLTNEPSFLLCSVVAYNIMCRQSILSLTEKRDFDQFYHKQNPIELKKFIAKCYFVLDSVSEPMHPRKYLDTFRGLNVGEYQVFDEYPKDLIEKQGKKLTELKREIEEMEIDEAKILLRRKRELDKVLGVDVQSVEEKRLLEMKKACNENLKDQQNKARKHLRRLAALRTKFEEEQSNILTYSKSEILKRDCQNADFLLDEIEVNKSTNEYEAQKAEDLILRHYSELMKHKFQIETLLNENCSPTEEANLHKTIVNEHRKISSEIKKLTKSSTSSENIRKFNVTSSLIAMEDLIKKVETVLAKELSQEYLTLSRSESNIRTLKLQSETKELELEVANLLKTMAKARIRDSKSKLLTIEGKNYSSAPSYNSASSLDNPENSGTKRGKKKLLKKKPSNKSVRFSSLDKTKSCSSDLIPFKCYS